MSNRYLKNRRFNESLENVAMWAYWQDTDLYAPDWKPGAEGAVYLEALSGTVVLKLDGPSALNPTVDESGWAWFIPLSEGLISVGVVRHRSAYSKSAQPNGRHIPQSSTQSQTTTSTASQNGRLTWDSSSHNSSTNSLSGTTPLSTLLSFRMIHNLQPNSVISTA